MVRARAHLAVKVDHMDSEATFFATSGWEDENVDALVKMRMRWGYFKKRGKGKIQGQGQPLLQTRWSMKIFDENEGNLRCRKDG